MVRKPGQPRRFSARQRHLEWICFEIEKEPHGTLILALAEEMVGKKLLDFLQLVGLG